MRTGCIGNISRGALLLTGVFLLLLAPPAFSLSVQILAEGVEVRVGPGLEYSLLRELNLFGIFPVLDQQGEWVLLRFVGYTGWIHKRWVRTVILDEQEKQATSYPQWPFDWDIILEIPFQFHDD